MKNTLATILVGITLVTSFAFADEIISEPQQSQSVKVKDVLLQTAPEHKDTKKGQEIASRVVSIQKTWRGNQWIEVQEIIPIENGLEAFVRVWDANNNPVGFGKDGTVEIERFRIINPPIMVPDGTKRIYVDERLGIPTELDNYKEDLREALLQSIESTLAVKQEKFGAEKIEVGKRGNTTTTVYPDTGNAGATTVDEAVQRNEATSWANQLGSGGTYSTYGATNIIIDVIEFRGQGSSNWQYHTRSFLHFDTSGIPDTDTITSATFSLYIVGNGRAGSNDPTVGLYSSTVTSNNNVVANGTDYSAVGTTLLSTASPAMSTISTSAYYNWTLNSSGLSNITKTGVSKFSIRSTNYDVGATEPPTNTVADTTLRVSSADNTGSSQDPKLVVESSAVSAEVPPSVIFFTE